MLVFGSLTLVFHDETFIKVKPTIIYTLFGATLIGGYLLDKPLLAIVFDSMFHLTEEGWRKLTLPLGGLLHRDGGGQRDRVAHPEHGFLGQLQAVRLHAADLRASRCCNIRC